VLSDLDSRRLKFAATIHPQATLVPGDIRTVKSEIVASIKERVGEDTLLLSITPPCQGMSANGIKTILRAVQNGLREPVDQRNYLILPALEIVQETMPDFVFFENVPEARSTYLIVDGRPVTVIDYISERLRGIGYAGEARLINFAEYGVPQTRKRIVAIFYKLTPHGSMELFPSPVKARPRLKDIIGALPKLDARNKRTSKSRFHPLHAVPVMRESLYEWVSLTPEGRSALENNECTQCKHLNKNDELYCAGCRHILPKPYVIKDGMKRLVKGYNSSYRRLRWNAPANTVTTRSAFASSAYNLHPSQNRVLSAYECSLLQGFNPEHVDWIEEGSRIYPDFLIREMIGEAVPVTFTRLVGEMLQKNASSYIPEDARSGKEMLTIG